MLSHLNRHDSILQIMMNKCNIFIIENFNVAMHRFGIMTTKFSYFINYLGFRIPSHKRRFTLINLPNRNTTITATKSPLIKTKACRTRMVADQFLKTFMFLQNKIFVNLLRSKSFYFVAMNHALHDSDKYCSIL